MNHAEMNLFQEYAGVSRYSGVPTEKLTGRLHYNENLYGPSPKCMESVRELKPTDLYLYESGPRDDLITAISEEIGIPEAQIFLNNGSAEIIKSIFSIVSMPGECVLLPNPGWSYYTGLADYKFCKTIYYDILEEKTKCRHDFAQLRELAKQHHPRIIIITSPAMPTGNLAAPDELEGVIRDFPDSLVLVDQAYHGFAADPLDYNRLITTYDNVVFSRTFSKYYGLANLRIGYGFCAQRLKDVLWLDMPLHRLSHVVKRMAIAAIRDKAYYADITKRLLATKEHITRALNEIPNVLVYESDTNFIYIGLTGYDVENIKQYCEKRGFLIRIFISLAEKHLRITIPTDDTEAELIQVLRDAIAQSKR